MRVDRIEVSIESYICRRHILPAFHWQKSRLSFVEQRYETLEEIWSQMYLLCMRASPVLDLGRKQFYPLSNTCHLDVDVAHHKSARVTLRRGVDLTHFTNLSSKRIRASQQLSQVPRIRKRRKVDRPSPAYNYGSYHVSGEM